MGDLLIVDYSPEVGKLVFSKEAGGALIHDDRTENPTVENPDIQFNSNAIAAAQPAPAKLRNE